MKNCFNCNSILEDNEVFCHNCGAKADNANQAQNNAQENTQNNAQYNAQNNGQGNWNANPNGQWNQNYQANYTYQNPYDHTAEFDAKDVSENKVYCMLAYLASVIGIIIALLAGKDSKYVSFHIRQAIKLSVVQILLAICAVIFMWTFIIPIAACVCMVIVFVLQIIAFFQICAGKAVEPAIIRSLGFLK